MILIKGKHVTCCWYQECSLCWQSDSFPAWQHENLKMWQLLAKTCYISVITMQLLFIVCLMKSIIKSNFGLQIEQCNPMDHEHLLIIMMSDVVFLKH